MENKQSSPMLTDEHGTRPLDKGKQNQTQESLTGDYLCTILLGFHFTSFCLKCYDS